MTQWGLDTLFNPAKRHMDEEKQRLQSTREEVGDNSGGKRIDLESGRVTISRGSADTTGEEDPTDPDKPASADADEADGRDGERDATAREAEQSSADEDAELTPAQRRARERRRRNAKK